MPALPPCAFTISIARRASSPHKARRKVAGEACLRCDKERKQHSHATPRVRSELESSQRMQARALDPGQHCETGPRTQGLLGRPQCLGRSQCSAHQHPRRVDTAFGERRCIRQMRRVEPGDAARHRGLLAGDQPFERRNEKAQLTDASAGMQDFDETRTGPAAAGQTLIEKRVFARYAGG